MDIRDLWEGNVSDDVALVQSRMQRVALDKGLRPLLDNNKDCNEKERTNIL